MFYGTSTVEQAGGVRWNGIIPILAHLSLNIDIYSKTIK